MTFPFSPVEDAAAGLIAFHATHYGRARAILEAQGGDEAMLEDPQPDLDGLGNARGDLVATERHPRAARPAAATPCALRRVDNWRTPPGRPRSWRATWSPTSRAAGWRASGAGRT